MAITLTRRQAQMAMLAGTLPGMSAALADEFPSKPVRLVLSISAGSGGDTVMRAFGEQLSHHLKRPVIIDNRPGADGLIAMQSLMSSPPDGYTVLMVGPQPMVYNPLLRSDLPYKVSDLRPLCGVNRGWAVLVTGSSSRFTTYDSFLTAARKGADEVSIGTDALAFRVGAALLGQKISADLNQIRYRAASQLLNDLSGNQLDVAFIGVAAVGEYLKAGKVRVLAVASRERLRPLPQLPTLREKGLDFDFSYWTALVVRAGTPDAVVGRLEGDLQKALHSVEFKAFLERLGGVLEVNPLNGQAVSAEVASETARYLPIVKLIAGELDVERR